MSGHIDFENVPCLPDWLLSEDSGVEDGDGFLTDELLSLGIADLTAETQPAI